MKVNLKFGRKSADADASGGDVKSSPKASKRKSRNESGGLKALILNHIEKVLLGTAFLLAGYLVYAGYQGRNDTRGKTPSQLEDTVDRAKQVLLRDTWRNAEDYLTPKLELGARARQTLQQMPDSAYSIPQSICPPVIPEDRKRGDPVLYTVEQLEVHTGYGALALMPDMDEEMMGEERTNRNRWAAPDPDEERRALRDAQTRFPNQARTMRGELKSVYFACVTGLVPYKKQWEAYRDAFLNAGGLDPSRDMPYYVYFQVERAEVSADGQLSEWTGLKRKAAIREEMRWGQPMRPVCDETYLDMALTRPIPPVIMRDLSSISRHSAVPTYEEGRIKRMAERRMRRPATEGEEGDPESEEDDLPGVMSGMQRGGGRGGEMGMGYGGEMGMGYGGEMGMGYDEGYGRGGEMGMGYDEGYGRGGDEGMMGGGRGTYGRSGLEGTGENIPDWKMFRFFDFTVLPGKTYSYRVRLLVEDPNNPNPMTRQSPAARYLERVVSDRLALLPKPEDPRKRVFWRETDWSQPSAPVASASGREILMGESKPTEMRSLTDPNTRQKIYFPKTGLGPSAKVMAKAWDPQRYTDVAVTVDVYRGSWPMVTDDLWVVDIDDSAPSLLKVPEYTVKSDTLVLDIRGGMPLDDSPWTAPGESLVMDAQGNLILRNEIADLEEFNRWDFPPDPREEMDGRGRGMEGGEGFGYGEEMFGEDRGGRSRRPGAQDTRGTRSRGDR